MNAEKQYLEIMQDILDNGIKSDDRTGTGTVSVFGRSIRHKYSDGFPLLTTKKMYTKGILGELLWFLMGTEDATFLLETKNRIWNEWMQEDENGKKILPHTYGVKWRDFDGVDQIQGVIDSIKSNPKSRRHVVSAWDPRYVEDAALPWCHILQQYHVVLDKDKPPGTKIPNDGRKGDLNIATYQRSCDFFFWGFRII